MTRNVATPLAERAADLDMASKPFQADSALIYDGDGAAFRVVGTFWPCPHKEAFYFGAFCAQIRSLPYREQ